MFINMCFNSESEIIFIHCCLILSLKKSCGIDLNIENVSLKAIENKYEP